MPHHPKSLALFEKLMKIDFELNDDYFCWKSGGDGDNGEQMLFELDILFEREDEAAAEQSVVSRLAAGLSDLLQYGAAYVGARRVGDPPIGWQLQAQKGNFLFGRVLSDEQLLLAKIDLVGAEVAWLKRTFDSLVD